MCRAECFKMQIKVNKMKYLIECMDEEGNWKIHNKGQTIEQAMEIINERK